MPVLTLHRKQMLKLSIPYWVFINGQPVGIMQNKEVSIQMPEGQYELSVRILFRLLKWQLSIGGEKKVNLCEGEHLHLMITDKEGLARRSEGGSQRWWNLLFDIDLVFWIAKFFFELPYPWDTVYEVESNGFFILWLARIWMIRNNYFELTEKQ